MVISDPFLPGNFGMYLTRYRYKEISRSLHFADNTFVDQSNDKFYKVSPLIETLNSTFISAYELGRYVSYDEAMIATLSKRVPCKVYNAMKPHKWGIKLHMVCCAETGYCTKFEVYKGKYDKKGNINEDKSGPASLIRNVKHLSYTNRVIFCDRFYTSLPSMIQLRSIGLFCCGTIMQNKKGFPNIVKIKSNEQVSMGTTRTATTSLGSMGKLCAVCWMDTKPVYLLSCGLEVKPCIVNRRSRGESSKKKVPCLTNIQNYHRFMGGVDRHDYLRMAKYSVQFNQIFKKWYKMFFCAMIDLVLVNSFVVWKILNNDLRKQKHDHASFNEQVALGLLHMNIGRSRSTTPIRKCNNSTSFSNTDNTNFAGHEIIRYEIGEGYTGREKRFRRCFVCQANGVRSHSEYYCNTCKVCVCMNASKTGKFCWIQLHTDERIKERSLKRAARIKKSLDMGGNSSEPSIQTPRTKRLRKNNVKKNITQTRKSKRNINKFVDSMFV